MGSERNWGQVLQCHTDALGSVTEMTDDTEATAQSYEYSAFGNITDYSGSLTAINPFTYTAREFDTESGLYYNRYRSYSPDIGRFITYDPVRWLGGLNLYVYAGNNPIGLTDALGLGSFWDSVVTAVSAVAIGVGVIIIGIGAASPVSFVVMAVGLGIGGIGVVALWLTGPADPLEEIKKKGEKPLKKRRDAIEKELPEDMQCPAP